MVVGSTTDPKLGRFLLAKLINRTIGANLTPWQIGSIPEDELDVFRVMMSEGKSYERAQETVSRAKSRFLAKHPTYGK